ncbi:mitochondrial potassium channel-like [Littorina saxatilis]|uniref:mitochondrial potassium channel-like n=1 Tax=Littorina saxatilis TaxID=31220 RepID=UPI0038B69A80
MQNTRRILLCLHRNLGIAYRHDIQVRHRSITGHMPTDVALKTVTGGRVDRWMQAYEDYVGLTEVKQAQNHVLQAEKKFLATQEERRHQQQALETIQSRLRAISAELEKTNRGDTRYLDLVQKEHAIIREENDVVSAIRNLEKTERESFAVLSSALRDSHEKERARAEKTKYWSIIGSIIGAIIGITGTTINNYVKMKELRNLVSTAGANSEELRNLSIQLCESVSAQSKKMDGLLVDLHASVSDGNNNNPRAAAQLQKFKFSPTANDIQQETEKILVALKSQEKNLDTEIQEIRKLLGIEKSQMLKGDHNVIYVGPEVQTMMRQTEENLERRIKYSALASATFVYGALALTIPIILSFFRGT